MCGRLNLHDSPHVQALMRDLGIELGPEIPESHNVAPTVPVPAVWHDGGEPRAALMRWGLTPRYWKPGATPPPLFNARDDSIWDKANYRGLIGKQHCVILANGFYEWQKTGGPKQPWYFHPAQGGALAFAGIWQEDAENGLECSMITTDANGLMEPVHNRMPVILDADQARTWLDAHDKADVNALMGPCPDDWLSAFPVSTYVNNTRNTGEQCIAKAE